MRRQPKYNFFKNSSYALSGLKDILKNETSFKIEVFLLVPIVFTIYFFDFDITSKIFLFISYFLVVISEAINSAIERVVDLVTLEYNEMAKRAKDVGSTIVFLSIVQVVVVWGVIFFSKYL